jgi:hypothetical protein
MCLRCLSKSTAFGMGGAGRLLLGTFSPLQVGTSAVGCTCRWLIAGLLSRSRRRIIAY